MRRMWNNRRLGALLLIYQGGGGVGGVAGGHARMGSPVAGIAKYQNCPDGVVCSATRQALPLASAAVLRCSTGTMLCMLRKRRGPRPQRAQQLGGCYNAFKSACTGQFFHCLRLPANHQHRRIAQLGQELPEGCVRHDNLHGNFHGSIFVFGLSIAGHTLRGLFFSSFIPWYADKRQPQRQQAFSSGKLVLVKITCVYA